MTMRPPLVVASDGVRYTQLDLDGVDILGAARSLRIDCQPNDLPRVTIELRCEAYTARFDSVWVELHMPDEVRDLLIARGWTPPHSDDVTGSDKPR